MIAAALRTEIDLFCRSTFERSELETLGRCALATQRLTQGLRAGGTEESLPSMRALGELVERAERSQPAVFLAYRAVTEQLAMHVAPSPGAARAREEAFDTIDGLVEDPTELPALRNALSTFCDHFQRLCQEATRAPRRSDDLTASAA
jgi:hypothetical protein